MKTCNFCLFFLPLPRGKKNSFISSYTCFPYLVSWLKLQNFQIYIVPLYYFSRQLNPTSNFTLLSPWVVQLDLFFLVIPALLVWWSGHNLMPSSQFTSACILSWVFFKSLFKFILLYLSIQQFWVYDLLCISKAQQFPCVNSSPAWTT